MYGICPTPPLQKYVNFGRKNRSYLGELEAEFKKTLAREYWGPRDIVWWKKNTKGQKSRDTFPLTSWKCKKMLRAFNFCYRFCNNVYTIPSSYLRKIVIICPRLYPWLLTQLRTQIWPQLRPWLNSLTYIHIYSFLIQCLHTVLSKYCTFGSLWAPPTA
jgi:hypothetical protein